MQGELTLHLSSSWMYIAYTLFLFVLTKKREKFFELIYAPLLMNWQKGGEKFRVLYMYMMIWQKGREKFGVLYMHIYVIYMHVYFFPIGIRAYMFLFSISIKAYMLICVICFMHTLNILIVYCYAWVKGSFYDA